MIASGMRAAYWPRKYVLDMFRNVVIVRVVVDARRRIPSLARIQGLVPKAEGTKPRTKKYTLADDTTTE
jgi:hypothetical protein